MKKTRILLVRNARGITDVTGAESYAFALMQGLDPARCECLLVAAVPPGPHAPWAVEAARRGLPHVLVPVSSRLALNDVLEIRRLIASFGADVVHTLDHRADIAGWLAVRGLDVPLVASFFGWTNWQTGSLKQRSYAWLDQQAQHRMDALITDSAYIAGFAGRGVGGAPVVVIPNGVDTGRFDPATRTPTMKREWFGDLDVQVVGMLGRVHPNKGQIEFVRAAAGLHAQHPRSRFVIVGAAPTGYEAYVAAVTSAIRSHGLEQVMLLTNVPSAEVPHAFAAMDIVTAPSHVESFSFTLLEAMCMARPVVATDVGGNREMMVDGESGLLVPPGDDAALVAALDGLLADPAFRLRLGTTARRRVVERFSVHVMAAKTLAVYGEVIEWRRSRRSAPPDRAALAARLARIQAS